MFINRKNLIMVLVMLVLLVVGSIDAKMFNPNKIVALKNILTRRFMRAPNPKVLIEAEIK